MPGGGTRKNESRRIATIRELKDETNLTAHSLKYLFTFNESLLNSRGKKRKIVNKHKVFLVNTKGRISVGDEVKHFAYYKDENVVPSEQTKKIIEKYLCLKK